MRLLGLDPGLRVTGWGVIEAVDGRLRHIGNGTVRTRAGDPIGARLVALYGGLRAVIEEYAPRSAAIEETFVNRNPQSALRLGLARGVVLLAPANAGLEVAEYAANLVKKSVVGAGHASKEQVAMMVATLLPQARPESADAADALAVAICHAHFSQSRARLAAALPAGTPAPGAQRAARGTR